MSGSERFSAPRIVATCNDHNGLLEAIRRRIAELGVSYETVNELAGLPGNYLTKIISDPPPKRMSPFAMFLVTQALGLDVQLVENQQLIEKLSKRWTKRKLRRPTTRVPDNGTHVYKYEVTPDLMRRRGRLGGYARAQYLSRERLSEIGRAAAMAALSILSLEAH
jgi:hypothetical protein